MQRSALCRSRRELSNEYLLAKIGVDTAENEPLEVWGKYSILFNRVLSLKAAPLALLRKRERISVRFVRNTHRTVSPERHTFEQSEVEDESNLEEVLVSFLNMRFLRHFYPPSLLDTAFQQRNRP